MSIPMATKRVGVIYQTLACWRIRYGTLKEEEAKRLQLLESPFLLLGPLELSLRRWRRDGNAGARTTSLFSGVYL